ncbi:hypothetical protein M0813_05489 [Anaeramoeba flamelloides]|uniref:Radical SAM core domain-containing protein n=1 Tax=Anaeramoeba flamelloides TaxID=1746091 RepID=A0ABQ8XGK7_9EUKA|nr:hypothetical protein M0813_05489 [Anaeramoeba flamelloides]
MKQIFSGTSSQLFSPLLQKEIVKLHLPTQNMNVISKLQPSPFGGNKTITSPISLTPYAGSVRCTARCKFCSECLDKTNSDHPQNSYNIISSKQFFSCLTKSLKKLRNNKVILCLSGLEPTSNQEWLIDCLRSVRAIEEGDLETKPEFFAKYLYSNCSGLAINGQFLDQPRQKEVELRNRLVKELIKYEPTDVYISRHHYDETVNQRIMQYHSNVSIKHQHTFEKTMIDLNQKLPMRLDAVLQKSGISNISRCEDYLNWAIGMGIENVFFRNLAYFNDDYVNKTNTSSYIANNRVNIDNLVSKCLGRHNWTPISQKVGYYYFCLKFNYKNKISATFEISDYGVLENKHNTNTIYKLILYPNGNLTSDWYPEKNVQVSLKNFQHLEV